MIVVMKDLMQYDWNGVMLYGKPDDESSWRWDTESRFKAEECLASAREIFEADGSTYQGGMISWEMEHKEGESGYEEECRARDEWEEEEIEIILPPD